MNPRYYLTSVISFLCLSSSPGFAANWRLQIDTDDLKADIISANGLENKCVHAIRSGHLRQIQNLGCGNLNFESKGKICEMLKSNGQIGLKIDDIKIILGCRSQQSYPIPSASSTFSCSYKVLSGTANELDFFIDQTTENVRSEEVTPSQPNQESAKQYIISKIGGKFESENSYNRSMARNTSIGNQIGSRLPYQQATYHRMELQTASIQCSPKSRSQNSRQELQYICKYARYEGTVNYETGKFINAPAVVIVEDQPMTSMSPHSDQVENEFLAKIELENLKYNRAFREQKKNYFRADIVQNSVRCYPQRQF